MTILKATISQDESIILPLEICQKLGIEVGLAECSEQDCSKGDSLKTYLLQLFPCKMQDKITQRLLSDV